MGRVEPGLQHRLGKLAQATARSEAAVIEDDRRAGRDRRGGTDPVARWEIRGASRRAVVDDDDTLDRERCPQGRRHGLVDRDERVGIGSPCSLAASEPVHGPRRPPRDRSRLEIELMAVVHECRRPGRASSQSACGDGRRESRQIMAVVDVGRARHASGRSAPSRASRIATSRASRGHPCARRVRPSVA